MKSSILLFLLMILIHPDARAGREEAFELQSESLVRSSKSVRYYGQLDLRHYTRTWFDGKNYLDRQEPSVHVLARAGASFYKNKLDIYGTAGFIKTAETQRLVQRRPELEVDYYPVSGTYGQVVLYNLLRLPFSEPGWETSADSPEQQGSVLITGVAPVFVMPLRPGGTRLNLKAGLDMWTYFYSRTQVVDQEDQKDEFEGFFLKKSATGEPVEDSKSPLYSKILTGAAWTPDARQDLHIEAQMHYRLDYEPVYEVIDGRVEGEYTQQRSASYRLRLRYRVNRHLTLANDFYQYFDGFFEGRRRGKEQRFRNLARVTTTF